MPPLNPEPTAGNNLSALRVPQTAPAFAGNALYERLIKNPIAHRSTGEDRRLNQLELAGQYYWLHTGKYDGFLAELIPLVSSHGDPIPWTSEGFKRDPRSGRLSIKYSAAFPDFQLQARWHTRVGDSATDHGAQPSWVIEKMPPERSKLTTPELVLVDGGALIARDKQEIIEGQPRTETNERILTALKGEIFTQFGGAEWLSGRLREILLSTVRYREQRGARTLSNAPSQGILRPQDVHPDTWKWLERACEILLPAIHFTCAPRREGFELLRQLDHLSGEKRRELAVKLLDNGARLPARVCHEALCKIPTKRGQRAFLNAISEVDHSTALQLACDSEIRNILGRAATRFIEAHTRPPISKRRVAAWGTMLAVVAAGGTFAALRAREYMNVTPPDSSKLATGALRQERPVTVELVVDGRRRVRQFQTELALTVDSSSHVDAPMAGSELKDARIATYRPTLIHSPLFAPLNAKQSIPGLSPRVHSIFCDGDSLYLELRFALSTPELEQALRSAWNLPEHVPIRNRISLHDVELKIQDESGEEPVDLYDYHTTTDNGRTLVCWLQMPAARADELSKLSLQWQPLVFTSTWNRGDSDQTEQLEAAEIFGEPTDSANSPHPVVVYSPPSSDRVIRTRRQVVSTLSSLKDSLSTLGNFQSHLHARLLLQGDASEPSLPTSLTALSQESERTAQAFGEALSKLQGPDDKPISKYNSDDNGNADSPWVPTNREVVRSTLELLAQFREHLNEVEELHRKLTTVVAKELPPPGSVELQTLVELRLLEQAIFGQLFTLRAIEAQQRAYLSSENPEP